MMTSGEALAVTKRYWQDAPVDVVAIAGELGLGPVIERLDDAVSGMIRKRSDGVWEIVINGTQSRVRQRFTIAHEIGHFIYHRDRLGAGTSDTLAYRTDARVYPNPLIGPTQEWQANNFASNLLIPDHVLRVAQSMGITDDVELSKQFDVSRAAMRIKLGLPALAPQPNFWDPAVVFGKPVQPT